MTREIKQIGDVARGDEAVAYDAYAADSGGLHYYYSWLEEYLARLQGKEARQEYYAHL